MKLRELIVGMDFAGVEGDEDTDVASLAYDSSRVAPGALFFCVRGQRADGHDFAASAVERGAAALVVERRLELPVPQVMVADARAAMAPIAVRFWDSAWEETSIAHAVSPASSILRNVACRSIASGVVRSTSSSTPPTMLLTVPRSPV